MDAVNAPTIVNLPDPELGTRALTLLTMLRPKLPVGEKMKRVGRDQDGGYVIADSVPNDAPIYSIGIGYECSFDLEMAKRGNLIFQYDHTVQGPPVNHSNFSFQPLALSKRDGPGAISLPRMLALNGHENRTDLFLKIDIEGEEYGVIKSLPKGFLARFDQIVIELHRFTNISDERHFHEMLDALGRLSLDHQVIHVHANNWGWYGFLGGVPIPDTFEVTYARLAGRTFQTTDQAYPTALDRPCNPAAADYFLGKIGA